MFELPTNTTEQIRPEVVNRIVETMFRTDTLNYCDTLVTMDGTPRFIGHYDAPRNDYTKAVRFTEDERKAAFEEFRKKGYHIAYEVWYSPVNCNRLWCYILKETKDTAEDRQFHYIF